MDASLVILLIIRGVRIKGPIELKDRAFRYLGL
jgi:hypothetical protein